MVYSNVIVDVTISRRSFFFGQSRAKVRQILWETCRPIWPLLFPVPNFPEIAVLKVNRSIRSNRPPGPEIGTAWNSQHFAQGAFCLRSLN